MSPTDPVEEARLVSVAEGFYVRVAVDNIAWIDLGGAALVVDALEQAHLAGEVFDAIDATLGSMPVRWVLNTHTHGDHTALNEAFRRRGAEIVNQRTAPLGAEGRWFEGPRRRVHMFPTPGCHTAEDCCVWAPGEKALFVGDIFGWGLIPLSAALNEESFRLLTDTYARLIGFEAATVVPGHGPVCTTAELTRQVEYYRWLIEQAAAAVAAGKSDSQIVADVAGPADMTGWWRFEQWKHADSLAKVLAAVRAGRLTPPA